MFNFLRPKRDSDYCQYPNCHKTIEKGGAVLIGDTLDDRVSVCNEHVARLFQIIVVGA